MVFPDSMNEISKKSSNEQWAKKSCDYWILVASWESFYIMASIIPPIYLGSITPYITQPTRGLRSTTTPFISSPEHLVAGKQEHKERVCWVRPNTERCKLYRKSSIQQKCKSQTQIHSKVWCIFYLHLHPKEPKCWEHIPYIEGREVKGSLPFPATYQMDILNMFLVYMDISPHKTSRSVTQIPFFLLVSKCDLKSSKLPPLKMNVSPERGPILKGHVIFQTVDFQVICETQTKKQKPLLFHYTDWLIGILMLAYYIYYNPYLTGYYFIP